MTKGLRIKGHTRIPLTRLVSGYIPGRFSWDIPEMYRFPEAERKMPTTGCAF